MNQIVKDFWRIIVAVLLLGVEMALNLPNVSNFATFTVWDYILWIFFFIFVIWQAIYPITELNEYRSQKGKLEFSSKPYSKSITINDIRKNQKFQQISSSTGTLAAIMMEIDDEEITPIIYNYKFLLIDVRNNPRINTENRVAKQVSAEITFFDVKHSPIKQEARWAFSKESDWYIGQEHHETLTKNLHCYKEWGLIIAFKNDNGNVYRLNESSYKSKELTNSKCQISKGIYDVHIRVWADNADEICQWYKLKASEFEMSPIEIPDWYKEI